MLERLFQGHLSIRPVQVEQVDVTSCRCVSLLRRGFESKEGLSGLLAQLRRGEASCDVGLAARAGRVRLGGYPQHRPLPRGQRRGGGSEEPFAIAPRVEPGGVDLGEVAIVVVVVLVLVVLVLVVVALL